MQDLSFLAFAYLSVYLSVFFFSIIIDAIWGVFLFSQLAPFFFANERCQRFIIVGVVLEFSQ